MLSSESTTKTNPFSPIVTFLIESVMISWLTSKRMTPRTSPVRRSLTALASEKTLSAL